MGFTQSARMLARRHNVDVASLIDILSHCRPYPSKGVDDFIAKYLDTIENMERDDIGNRYIVVPNADGSKSNVMWSCHTDSVHAPTKDGRQNVKWDNDGNILSLNDGKAGQCLGADDGAGMWLMLEMLKVGKPGLYIFHAGEEKGGIGSRWLVKNTPQIVDGIDYAIAFDRADLTSIITHQGGQRCCSDTFGKALGASLGADFKLDTGGSFTDTKMYVDLVAECTNVSVGYYHQHGPRETLDVRQVLRLREALLRLDASTLPVERKAGDKESLYSNYGGYGGYSSGRYNSTASRTPVARQASAYQSAYGGEDLAYEAWLKENTDDAVPLAQPKTDRELVTRLCKQFPEAVARILIHFGVSAHDIADTVMGLAGIPGSADGLLAASGAADNDVFDNLADADSDLAWSPDKDIDDRIECENCAAKVDVADITDKDECPFCYANMSDAFNEALEAQDNATGRKLDSIAAEKMLN